MVDSHVFPWHERIQNISNQTLFTSVPFLNYNLSQDSGELS